MIPDRYFDGQSQDWVLYAGPGLVSWSRTCFSTGCWMYSMQDWGLELGPGLIIWNQFSVRLPSFDTAIRKGRLCIVRDVQDL